MTDITVTEATDAEITDAAIEAVTPVDLKDLRIRMNLSRRELSEMVDGMTQAKLVRLEAANVNDLSHVDRVAWVAIYDALVDFEGANPTGKPKATPKVKMPKAPKVVVGYDKAEVAGAVKNALILAQVAYNDAKAKKASTAQIVKVVDALIELTEHYTGE